jgi:hypothetical protein
MSRLIRYWRTEHCDSDKNDGFKFLALGLLNSYTITIVSVDSRLSAFVCQSAGGLNSSGDSGRVR